MDQVDHNWAIFGSNVQRFGTAMRLPLTLRMAAAAVPERYGNPLRLDRSFCGLQLKFGARLLSARGVLGLVFWPPRPHSGSPQVLEEAAYHGD